MTQDFRDLRSDLTELQEQIDSFCHGTIKPLQPTLRFCVVFFISENNTSHLPLLQRY